MAQLYQRVGHFKEVESFRAYLRSLDIQLPMDVSILSAADQSPMAMPLNIGGFEVGNRWCIHPMEGWDGTPDGRPSPNTIRRWQRFGLSGAKLIWGGEALAVQYDGRANPNQLYYRPENTEPIQQLLRTLTDAHVERFGTSDDLLVGLQLTHSGRYSRPSRKDRLQPRIVYRHPLLDKRCGIEPDDDSAILSDAEIERLIKTYVHVAQWAQKIGFRFVDVKCCHGYLGHEFLSAFDRPGSFGGHFEGRTLFIRRIIEGIKAKCPDLLIGVRLSAYDAPPFQPDPQTSVGGKLGSGVPESFDSSRPYPGFGLNRDNPLEIELAEPVRLLKMLRDDLGVAMVNLSCGSPYYNPHIQRPAFFPPSDGYQPPEDPLIGCARQIEAVRELKQQVPDLPMVGTAYTYFQEFLPHIAQAVVRDGWVDSVGIGRLVLSYPDLPADCLEAGELKSPRLICRTFSDCTTAPRSGIVSGCFPLDDYYKQSGEHGQLKQAKAVMKEKLKAENA